MSLFGNSTNQNPGGSLFGSNSNQGYNTGGGLFGSGTATNQANKPAPSGGLFGSSITQNNTGSGGNLFGASTAQSSGGLFGSNPTPNQSNTGAGLFAPSTNPNTTSTAGGLFGSSTTQNAAGTGGGGGLFGSSTTNQNTDGSSLFGGNQNNAGTQQNTANPAFGGATTTAQPSFTNSLFGGGLFGSSITQPQQNTQQNALQQQTQPLHTSLFAPPTVTIGHHTMSQAQLQRLQFLGYSSIPNEKNIAEQLATVANKWNPDNTPVTTTLKTYLYNAVPKEYAPFYYPNPQIGEDEKSWEEALSQKPEPPKVDGQEVTSTTYVPLLCKGFKALGQRVETQANIITEMRSRLHEMNNSLSAVMAAHQQKITIRIASAKRQHQILSQRCLQMAAKVQVLRNRGYALDTAEESLRKTLLSLEKQVMDPALAGREDEIWARMGALRERARWLEEEGKRVSAQIDEQNRQNNHPATGGVPEHVIRKTKKILKDYDGQLQHLSRELDGVKKEYAEWEDSQRERERER